jgi:serine/threonine protein kinase
MHRDLKPENVLLDEDGYVKLADFGLAKFMAPNQVAKSFCGTAEYLAPEILTQTGHNKSVDWWTFGILLYEMITGRPPFMHSNQNKLSNLIKQGVVIFPHPERHGIPMSDELKDIITRLLDKNPATRLGSVNDADDIVNHPWFATGVDFEKMLTKGVEAPFKPDMERLKKKDPGEGQEV